MILYSLLMTLLLTCTGFSYIYAEQNTASIRVACVIPEIPGVNVPLVPERASSARQTQPNQTIAASIQPLMIQKDTAEVRIINGKTQMATVQTIYQK